MYLKYQFSWRELAHHLLDDLVASPKSTLPGVDRLAKQNQVSRLTVKKALEHLEMLEVIHPAECGKKRKINLIKLQEVVAMQGHVHGKQIVFIAEESEFDGYYLGKHIFSFFREQCAQDGYLLSFVEGQRTPPSKLKALLEALRPSGAFILKLGAQVSDIVLSLDIPAVKLARVDPRLPCVVHTNSYTGAWLRARKAGHIRIAIPVVNVEVAAYERVALQMEQLAAQTYSTFSRNYNFPVISSTSVEDYHSVMHNLFRYTPPTCLILEDLSHYLASSSFLQQRGLRIPADVSIILLSQDPLLADILPSIAHYSRFSENTLLQAYSILKERMDGLHSKEQVRVDATWVPGGSLAAPKSA